MKLIVLGSGAGGGSPQWNCRCAVCALFWSGDPRVQRRTQCSLAISADGADWALLNCTPDIREQIGASPALWPRRLRESPIRAIVLTGAEIDQLGGLLSLRERAPLDVFAPVPALDAIRTNPMFGVLDPDYVRFIAITPGSSFSPLPGLEAKAFSVPSKIPLYSETDDAHPLSREAGSIGLLLRSRGDTVAFVPGCGAVDERLLQDVSGADVLFFDGTLWRDDELLAAKVGHKTGARMGHIAVSGEHGSMKLLETLDLHRRIYIHLNNTNPLLVEGTPERAEAEASGWEIAHDGMEMSL